MFVGQPFDAFQFHQQCVLDEEIGEVFSHAFALVDHGKGSFRNRVETTDAQFFH
jgi:hypothetical protein